MTTNTSQPVGANATSISPEPTDKQSQRDFAYTRDHLSPPEPSYSVSAEFVDSKGLRALFGISRSLAYILIAEGRIRSVSLRQRGRLRGKRLFSVESVRSYLASCIDEREVAS